jgi:hypothetical protein
LYYAVTGKVPFPGGSTREKLRRHLDEAPLAPTLFAPQLDPRLAELIAHMMHKRAAERLKSAAEVVERLRPWTSAADENTWRQIGEFAAEPSNHSITGATLADTVSVEAGEIDTGEQTPAGRMDATASIPGLSDSIAVDVVGGGKKSASAPVVTRFRVDRTALVLISAVALTAAVAAGVALFIR